MLRFFNLPRLHLCRRGFFCAAGSFFGNAFAFCARYGKIESGKLEKGLIR
jgi:hypothetical protein